MLNRFPLHTFVSRAMLTSAMLFANLALAQTETTKPDALLAIDMNRSEVAEKINRAWVHEIPFAQRASLREKLGSLRADELLAASLAGSFEGVLEVLASASTSIAAERYVPALGSAKTLFATRHDLPAALLSAQSADRAKAVGETARDLVYTPLTPCRLFDSRDGQPSAVGQLGGVFSNQMTRLITSGDKCGIPGFAGGRGALFLTFHAYNHNPSALGVIGFMKSGTPFSGLAATWTGSNWLTGSYITEVDTFGGFDIFVGNNVPMTADVVVDVVGSFQPANRNGEGLRVVSSTAPGFSAPNIVNGSATNIAQLGIAGATIAGGGAAPATVGGAASPNTVSGHFGTIGGGRGNVATAEATVAGGRSNTAGQIGATVGGGASNLADCDYATIGGGQANTASGCWSTVAGGRENVASGIYYSTVGGGRGHRASGDYAVVSGGFTNAAAGNQSTISGGANNSAQGQIATISGGSNNSASGLFATIPGGTLNVAGDYSFAVGTRAKATHSNAFVWGGNTGADTNSPGPGTFMVYAPSGATIGTASGTCTLTNSTGWSCTSDRNLKTAFAKVSPRAVLQRLIAMPVTTWSMQGSFVRQMGPTAQDFSHAFGLGASATSINHVDAQGVAFAAIQGLNQKLVEESKAKDAKLAVQTEKLSKLERELANIKRKLGL